MSAHSAADQQPADGSAPTAGVFAERTKRAADSYNRRVEVQSPRARAALTQAREIMQIARDLPPNAAEEEIARGILELEAARARTIDELLTIAGEMVQFAHAAKRALAGMSSSLERAHKLLLAERRAGRIAPEQGRTGPAGRRRAAIAPVQTARLVALELALGGSSRSEVEQVLRNTVAIDDPSAVIDEVFGAAGSDETSSIRSAHPLDS